jgi:hypothetical protein
MSHQSSAPDGRQGVEFSARLPKIGRGRQVMFIRGGRWEEEASKNSQDPDLCRPPGLLKRRQGPRGPTRGGVWPLTVKVWPTVPCVSRADKQGPRAPRASAEPWRQARIHHLSVGDFAHRSIGSEPACPRSERWPHHALLPARERWLHGPPHCRPPDRTRQDRQPNHSRRRDRRPAGRPIAGPSTGTADGSPAVDRSTTSRPHPRQPRPGDRTTPAATQPNRSTAKPRTAVRRTSTTAPPTVSGGTADRPNGRTVRRWSRTLGPMRSLALIPLVLRPCRRTAAERHSRREWTTGGISIL